MNNFKTVEEKVKDLVAECHEHGIPYIISITDESDGKSLCTIEGTGEPAIIMMGILIQRIAKSSGLGNSTVIALVSAAAEAAKEVEEESEKVTENEKE